MIATALDEAPDFIEPLTAWRTWRVVRWDRKLSLASVVKRTVWPANEPLVAQCLRATPLLSRLRRRPSHPAPAERCDCGVYATALEGCVEYLLSPLPEALAHVFGRVALWGCVVECERGFRASHAYPLELFVPADASADGRAAPDEIAAGLGLYGVRVELLTSDRRDAPSRVAAGREP